MDLDDWNHEACVRLLETHPGPLIVPAPVATVAAMAIRRSLGVDAELAYLTDLASDAFTVMPLSGDDWLRVAQLVHRHRRIDLPLAVASVLALSERLGVTDIGTTTPDLYRSLGLKRLTAVRLWPFDPATADLERASGRGGS